MTTPEVAISSVDYTRSTGASVYAKDGWEWSCLPAEHWLKSAWFDVNDGRYLRAVDFRLDWTSSKLSSCRVFFHFFFQYKARERIRWSGMVVFLDFFSVFL